MKRSWLEKIRIEKELTHQDIAKKVGISRSYYTRIENGKRKPSPEVAILLGEALGFDWREFYQKASA